VRLGILLILLPFGAQAQEKVWVFFADKPDGAGSRLLWQDESGDHSDAELDLPIDSEYVRQLQKMGLVPLLRSRWFNAISIEVAEMQREWLEGQSFVRRVQPVRRMRRPQLLPEVSIGPASAKAAFDFDYGPAFDQLAQIGVVELHSLGYDGEGVRIALIDNGFHYLHDSFAQLEIVAERDFVNSDDVVIDESDQPVTGDETKSVQNIHGAQVLSLLAGYEPGRFIGVAPQAEYILAKTEDNRTELPIEEDRWIAGLEWADSLGADVVNSSLGYNLWDDGSGYTYEDLDGATALTSIAAELAVRRGIVMVVAAGNEGDNSWRYVTAPADAPGVITVGSVDVPTPGVREPLLAASSSRGPTADGRIKPDVVAPGQWVVAADIRGGDYVRVNGTSFASPMVGGVCALLLQAHPTWSPAEVQEALQRSAIDLGEAGPDTAYGWGMVDALGASGLQLQRPESLLAGNPFPNPASGEAIHFPLVLNDREDVELRIFDLAGGLVASVEKRLLAGDYTAPERALLWEIPGELADGLYFYLMKTSSLSRSGKFALVRHRSRMDRQP
jgi:serine protease AprX